MSGVEVSQRSMWEGDRNRTGNWRGGRIRGNKKQVRHKIRYQIMVFTEMGQGDEIEVSIGRHTNIAGNWNGGRTGDHKVDSKPDSLRKARSGGRLEYAHVLDIRKAEVSGRRRDKQVWKLERIRRKESGVNKRVNVNENRTRLERRQLGAGWMFSNFSSIFSATFAVNSSSRLTLAMVLQGMPSHKFSVRVTQLPCSQITTFNCESCLCFFPLNLLHLISLCSY